MQGRQEGCVVKCAWARHLVSYLIDVWVPHLGEEPEGWWGIRVVDGELEASLQMAESGVAQWQPPEHWS